MDAREGERVPLRLQRKFSGVLYTRLIRTRSANSALKGLGQCLLRMLPGRTKRSENSRTPPQGDPIPFPGLFF